MQSQQNDRLSILCVYGRSQTFTQTVFEHAEALGRYSCHEWSYLDHELLNRQNFDWDAFDAVAVHYSVRLPYDQIDSRGVEMLAGYQGLKILFIQDEYDRTDYTKSLIRKIGFDLVFTVVPPQHVKSIYPPTEFPGVVFVSNLTGYVPDDLAAHVGPLRPPSKRSLMVGYRGRPLPIRYGRLGQEKVEIGRLVKEYCDARSIPNDIAWSEEARIYGTRWYGFLASCRAMLGSESGSNVFDWDGSLDARISDYRRANPLASDAEVYRRVVLPQERPGLMNQISPRLFEAIASKTVLVLFEGEYSDVVKPGEHYIAVRKDGSNLDEVLRLLRDDQYIDRMVQHAYSEIIDSGKYSYRSFLGLVDARINELFEQKGAAVPVHRRPGYPRMVMTNMAMSRSPLRPRKSSSTIKWILQVVFFPVRPLWRSMPEFLKRLMRPVIKKIFY